MQKISGPRGREILYSALCRNEKKYIAVVISSAYYYDIMKYKKMYFIKWRQDISRIYTYYNETVRYNIIIYILKLLQF